MVTVYLSRDIVGGVDMARPTRRWIRIRRDAVKVALGNKLLQTVILATRWRTLLVSHRILAVHTVVEFQSSLYLMDRG